MSTLVCFALKEEAAPFHKVAKKSNVTILIVGIGRQNAEKSIREFFAENPPDKVYACGFAARAPHRVFTCGFAGGLNPDLKLGDVVFETISQSEPAYAARYRQLEAAGAKPVKFFCADRVATTIAEKKQLRDDTGADAVEMESAAIQAVCAEKGIPCITVRVISDTANEDLPLDFNQLAKPDKSLDFGKLALAIAKSPGKIGALMELQKKTSFAAHQLAAVLVKITSP